MAKTEVVNLNKTDVYMIEIYELCITSPITSPIAYHVMYMSIVNQYQTGLKSWNRRNIFWTKRIENKSHVDRSGEDVGFCIFRWEIILPEKIASIFATDA